jgi:predicted transcriptional regulator
MPHAYPQPPRRGAGELEAAVLSVLWEAGRALSPGEVQQALAALAGAPAPELSYSTVVTILSRLHAKKVLDRRRDGRAFRYAPVADEAGLAARRMAAMLDKEPDRQAVLSRFVADLSGSDEQLLRALLGDGGQEAG